MANGADEQRSGRLDIRAIFLGVAVDWSAGIIFSIVMFVVLKVWFGLHGVEAGEFLDAAETVSRSRWYLGLFLPFGFMFTAAGGYVATRFADDPGLLNAAFVGVAGIVIGFAFMQGQPSWYNYVGVAGAVPAAVLGGYVHARRWNFG